MFDITLMEINTTLFFIATGLLVYQFIQFDNRWCHTIGIILFEIVLVLIAACFIHLSVWLFLVVAWNHWLGPTKKRLRKIITGFWNNAQPLGIVWAIDGIVRSKFSNLSLDTDFRARWLRASSQQKMNVVSGSFDRLYHEMLQAKSYEISVAGPSVSMLRVPMTMQQILVRSFRSHSSCA